MAEAIGKHFLGHRIYFDSIGVRTGELNPFTVAVLDEIGIDISGHIPKSFEGLQDKSYDLVVSLTPEAQHQAVEMTRTISCTLEYWPTADPSIVWGNRDSVIEAFRKLRDTLVNKMSLRFEFDKPPEV
jgi:protein-tyrosine-phosphatase